VLTARDGSNNNILGTFLPQVGNTVRIVAQLRNNTTNSFVSFPTGVSFTVIPSRLEGVAINDVEVSNAAGEFSNDYSLNATDKTLLTRTLAGGATAVEVLLFSFDYGGTASVTVRTTAPDGSTVRDTLTLPLDSDSDGVPDAWEVTQAGFDPYNAHSFNTQQLDGAVDLDTSLDNTFNGDGLRAERECRGVVFGTGGDKSHRLVHERLDPRKKDLFVRGDNFANSLPPNTMPNVLAFSMAVPGGNAFENAGIVVHDVTGLPTFSGATEPPFLDIAVVTNETAKTDTRAPGGGVEDGFLNHIASLDSPRFWTWDAKGDSCIGTATAYAQEIDTTTGQVICTGTRLYHLNLFHYFFNRPYQDEVTGHKRCGSTLLLTGTLNPSYQGKLDPLAKVEDFRTENGLGPERQSGTNEDRFIKNGLLDGDCKQTDWKGRGYGSQPYQVGYQVSVFDVEGDGLVENPPIADPLTPATSKEYTLDQVQIHTAVHEAGHAVGICPFPGATGDNRCHTTDPTDVMANHSNNWDRAGSFSALSRSLILIHNR
jgi:hypothetical protein